MKKILIILLYSTYSFLVKAQTGIGTTTPDASAKLEVAATNKGFLPPRVALTATNAASPITSPANGLMVFNTVTAGTNPYQVVPGYYYWDGVGLRWVSLSTTVGNVQNQGIFRSTSNTAVNSVVSSWNTRFNNIASGDLIINSNTTFALSNGIYKIEWALPYQSSSTYNIIQLQENMSGTWNALFNDAGYSTLGNGGNTDWGGGTFAADIVDCSSNTRTFRFYNLDIYRQLYYGITFIITKLNPSITTSTTADNLGNHTATKNILLSGNYLSNDGGNEGVSVDNAGNVGIGTNTPSAKLHLYDNSNTSWWTGLYLDGNAAASGTQINIRNNNDKEWHIDHHGSSGLIPNALNFWNNTSNTNVLTIATDGKVNLNTSNASSLEIISTTADNNGMILLNANTSQNWANGWHEFIRFFNQGSVIGEIKQTNASTIAYSTTSDYRLKTDFKNFIGLNLISKLKPYDYAWKVDSSRMYGFKAHELQEVLPYLVSGKKDAVDEQGKIMPQTVDYSKLTPILVKAIQEQEEKIKMQDQKMLKLDKERKSLEKRVLELELLIKKLVKVKK